MKLPSRFFFSLCLVSMFSMTLLFADNSISRASMTVEAYKEIPKPDGVFEVKVMGLDGTRISGLNETFDISELDVTSLNNVFVVNVRSNYGDNVKFKFRFSPFVNQINKSKTLPTTYSVSAGSKQEVSNGSYSFAPSFSPDITSATNSPIVDFSNSSELDVDYSIECRDGGVEYAPGSGVISNIGDKVVEANIYGTLRVDKAGIEPNVDYISTVVISMEVL